MGPTRHFGAPVAGPTAIVGTSLGHTNPCVELNGHSTLNGATPPSIPHGKSAVNKFARALFVFATATALATVGCTGAKLYIGFSVNSRTAKSRACPSAYPNRGRASATPEDAKVDATATAVSMMTSRAECRKIFRERGDMFNRRRRGENRDGRDVRVR